MENKIFYLAIASFFILLSSLALTSAYPYYAYPYGNDYYDSYSYSSSRTSGYDGYLRTSSTFLDRTTSNRYLPDGSYEKRTTYTYTTRESPDRYGYRYGYYDYQPWYQKYWSYPKNYYYYNYQPYYYRYDYYPSYRYYMDP